MAEFRTWVEIDLDKLKNNIACLQERLPQNSEFMAVVKANGYGHDAVAVSRICIEMGIKNFAVATLEEGIQLREAGISGRILILGYTVPQKAKTLIQYDLTQTIVDEKYAEILFAEVSERIKVHIAIDTGMSRIGFPEEPEKIENLLSKYESKYQIEGLFTHLCIADSFDKAARDFTYKQIAKFKSLIPIAECHGAKYNHFLNSAGGLFYSDDASKFVRYGIVMYGLKPDISLKLPEPISPILSWKAVIEMVKTIHKGDTVGYGCSFMATRDTIVATVAVGYADGYPRLLSNKGCVLLHGKRVPVIGRVCMDQLMIDITEIGDCVTPGETVTLVGSDGKETILIDELASSIGTIGYECVCNIARRVPRVFLQNGVAVHTIE